MRNMGGTEADAGHRPAYSEDGDEEEGEMEGIWMTSDPTVGKLWRLYRHT